MIAGIVRPLTPTLTRHGRPAAPRAGLRCVRPVRRLDASPLPDVHAVATALYSVTMSVDGFIAAPAATCRG
jgi:hypothetical protein